jgi:hypothetical protein
LIGVNVWRKLTTGAHLCSHEGLSRNIMKALGSLAR